MVPEIKRSGWISVIALLALCGCASPALVEPEHDLARQHQAEIDRLRAEAEVYCAGVHGGVGSLQIRVKRLEDGVLASMEATCKAGDVKIGCELVPDKGSEPNCRVLES